MALGKDGEAVVRGGDHGERPLRAVAVGVSHGAVCGEGVQLLKEHAGTQRLTVAHLICWKGGSRRALGCEWGGVGRGRGRKIVPTPRTQRSQPKKCMQAGVFGPDRTARARDQTRTGRLSRATRLLACAARVLARAAVTGPSLACRAERRARAATGWAAPPRHQTACRAARQTERGGRCWWDAALRAGGLLAFGDPAGARQPARRLYSTGLGTRWGTVTVAQRLNSTVVLCTAASLICVVNNLTVRCRGFNACGGGGGSPSAFDMVRAAQASPDHGFVLWGQGQGW